MSATPFKHGVSPDGKTVTLTLLDNIAAFLPCAAPAANEELLNILVLDTETTGLDFETDEMVEIGVAAFQATTAGSYVKYLKTANWLQEPSKELSDIAQAITGLTRDALIGEQFDDEAINKALDWADIIIAHNAEFDYNMMAQRYPDAVKKAVWLCSSRQVNWLHHGHDSAKLSLLSYEHGFFYAMHRTEGDIHAVAYLLSKEGVDGRPYLAELLDKRSQPQFLIAITKAPYDANQHWRGRRYRWMPKKKVWWKKVTREELEAESIYISDAPGLGKKVTWTSCEIPAEKIWDKNVTDILK